MNRPRLHAIAVVLLSASLLGACVENANRAYIGRVPFNDDFVDQPGSNSTTAAKARLQYYVSDDVVLTVNPGVIPRVTSRGKQAPPPPDEIRIPAGSIARALASGEGWIAVSFSNSVYLYFVSDSSPRSPRVRPARAADRYYLYASDIPDHVSQVRIGDKVYDVHGTSTNAYLLVDSEALSVSQREPLPTDTLPDDWLGERRH